MDRLDEGALQKVDLSQCVRSTGRGAVERLRKPVTHDSFEVGGSRGGEDCPHLGIEIGCLEQTAVGELRVGRDAEPIAQEHVPWLAVALR